MTQLGSGTGYARPRAEGQTIAFLGSLMTVKATGAETGGAFGLIEQVAPAGFAAPPHVHHGEDEAFYILEGELTFTCGDQRWQAAPGAFIFLPRDVTHHFTVSDAAPARLLQLNAPAGLERFFLEMGEPATGPALPPPAPPDVPRLLALAARYDVELLGGPHP